jgi:hypothetical protein
VRAVYLSGLVVLGLASIALADESATIPSGRPSWDKVYAEFEKADREYGHVIRDMDTVTNRLRDADYKLAPLRAIEADLSSRVNANDPKLAEARRAIMARTYELKVGENSVQLIKLQKQELAAREAAIVAGEAARKALDSYFDRMGMAKDVNREKQVADARTAWLDLVTNLDALVQKGNPLTPPFTPLDKAPNNLRQIVDWIGLYELDAKQCSEFAESLSQRSKVMKADQARLLKFKQDEAKLPRLDDQIKRLEARIEQIDSARQAASKRADDIRQEIGRLQTLKAEKEKALSNKQGAKDGEKKDGEKK